MNKLPEDLKEFLEFYKLPNTDLNDFIEVNKNVADELFNKIGDAASDHRDFMGIGTKFKSAVEAKECRKTGVIYWIYCDQKYYINESFKQ